MLVLAPAHHRLYRSRFYSPASMPGYPSDQPMFPEYPVFDRHFVTLIAAAADTAGLRLDGLPIGARLAPFPGDPRYLSASIPIAAGSHRLEAPNGVIAHAYGWGHFDGYSYRLGADTLMVDMDDPLADARSFIRSTARASMS